ncbi:Glycosyl transferases group 1 [Catalinimonas alkaloidigena]|uniref:Glycosyl transferases group 1 n=1 Tax=Catalinimonas alkaloidigena TaxID=1075417 RepID=A0A1G9LFC2_9BACT|nr:glycosyltransferase [Catalinimonas alkaloidigena]SDL60215.1 Glycosyl transferases group 1 [Catalinimonas alkaloidigena]
MKERTVILAHAGKQHSYQVAKALLELECLEKFYTSSYVSSALWQRYFLQTRNTYFSRRFLPGLSGKRVDANWRFEVKEVLLRKAFGKSKRVQEAVYARDVAFDQYVARQLRRQPGEIYWGFQGSCYASLQAARAEGKITLCELATAHVTAAKRILGEEARLHPEWADSIDNLEFPASYEKRLEEEPLCADWTIAASDFTRRSLLEAGVPADRILVLPLGFDPTRIPFHPKKESDPAAPLKLLYAGTVTQRKGVKYLLEAMQGIAAKEVELHVIGGIQGSGKAFRQYERVYTYHPPVAQETLFEAYGQYDALVLPTIFEGFGLVIVEALAAGLPVITTSHSTGEALIKNGDNGYLVPIRDVSALRTAIEALKEKKATGAYLAMRANARQSVEEYSWLQYQSRLEALLKTIS